MTFVKAIGKSKIFTNAELKILKSRLEGSKADPHGLFSARVKPKLREILIWQKEIRTIKKLI